MNLIKEFYKMNKLGKSYNGGKQVDNALATSAKITAYVMGEVDIEGLGFEELREKYGNIGLEELIDVINTVNEDIEIDPTENMPFDNRLKSYLTMNLITPEIFLDEEEMKSAADFCFKVLGVEEASELEDCAEITGKNLLNGVDYINTMHHYITDGDLQELLKECMKVAKELSKSDDELVNRLIQYLLFFVATETPYVGEDNLNYTMLCDLAKKILDEDMFGYALYIEPKEITLPISVLLAKNNLRSYNEVCQKVFKALESLNAEECSLDLDEVYTARELVADDEFLEVNILLALERWIENNAG